MHVVKPCTIKSTDDVHDISKNYSSVESSRLWILPIFVCLDFTPLSLVEIVRGNVVETSLVCINTTKYNHALVAHNSSVSVTRRWFYSTDFSDFVPVLGS